MPLITKEMGIIMDVTSLLGLTLGAALLVGSIVINGPLSLFWDGPSVLIVFGGTLGAIMINYPFKDLVKIGSLLRIIFTNEEHKPQEVIKILVSFAEVSRREGLLALEERAQEVDEPFLQKGIQLVVDGTDPELVRSILEIELSYLEDRHVSGQEMFEQMGAYAPAFGMLGTIIGLIAMLQELDSPDSIGTGMATALITTFYGSILANLVFLPMAGKLRVKSAQELLIKEIMIEGILSIRAGENPRIVEEKLNAFLPRFTKISQDSALGSEEEGVRVGV